MYTNSDHSQQEQTFLLFQAFQVLSDHSNIRIDAYNETSVCQKVHERYNITGIVLLAFQVSDLSILTISCIFLSLGERRSDTR